MARKELLDGSTELATLDDELFKAFVNEVLNEYKMGTIELSLVGPRTNLAITSALARDLQNKFKVTDEEFKSLVSAFLSSLHQVLACEEKEVLESLIKNGKNKEAKMLEQKYKFLKEAIDNFPGLEEQYFVQTYSKSAYFKNIAWEANKKILHSPREHPRHEPPLNFVFARIRIALADPEYPIEEMKTNNIDFEASLYDVEVLIKSLNELKSALNKIRKEK